MGDSHFRSDVYPKDSTGVIRGFATISATSLVGPLTGNVTGDVTGSCTGYLIKSTGYIQMGDHQYMFFGAETAEANVVAAATAVDASVKGSLYVSTGAAVWLFDADDTATRLQVY